MLSETSPSLAWFDIEIVHERVSPAPFDREAKAQYGIADDTILSHDLERKAE